MSYPNHDAGPPKKCKLCYKVYTPTPGQKVQKYCPVCGEKLKAPRPWAVKLIRENTDLKFVVSVLRGESLQLRQTIIDLKRELAALTTSHDGEQPVQPTGRKARL